MHLSSTDNTQDSSDDPPARARESNLSDCTGTKPKFKFPPPPRLIKSANNSCCSTASDSSTSSVQANRSYNFVKKKRHRATKRLPPLGIYWDIENCHVPKNKSAAAVVQRIRETFLENYRESEFIVVCDVKKENPQVIQELHDAQVNLIHVASTSKNAADEKLRQSLRRFGELHSAPAGVLLISGDINFAADLSDLRYRNKIRVILVHNVNVADALILCANEHHSFTELMKDIPANRAKVTANTPSILQVSNLPLNFDPKRLRSRLRMLIENCGGKVLEIYSDEGTASIRFGNSDAALRAQRRIQGEDVYGNKIKVISPSIRNYSGNRLKSLDSACQEIPLPPPGFTYRDILQNSAVNHPHGNYNSGMLRIDQAENLSMSAPASQGFMGYNQQRRQMQQQQHQMDSCTFRPIIGSGCIQLPYDCREGSLTPQEQLGAALGPRPRIHKTSGSSDYSEDGKAVMIMRSVSEDVKSMQQTQPVDLIISNLDSNIDTKELKKMLSDMINQYATILNMNVIVQTDGNSIAYVRLSSQQEASFVISQLHRVKLGHKRIVISHIQSNSPDPEQLKAMVVSILQEAPEKSLPLYRLIDILESRYHCTVPISEVNKLKDVCNITVTDGSRFISLTQNMKTSPPPTLSSMLLPYCTIHCPEGMQNRDWSELGASPCIMMPLKMFADKLHSLLKIHLNYVFLLSFQICYESEFHEHLPVLDSGVPLEHLVSCVPNVGIEVIGPNKNIKVIKYNENKSNEHFDESFRSVPLPLAMNLNMLCRELVELLKTTEKCQLLLIKFIPAYHHHFGKQCRVADYGYTKLLDLFESIPHVVQLIGDGTRRIVTLSHSAQMKRFTSDLLRVLKAQPSKEINISAFPSAYEKVVNKPFNVVDYGLCTFEDLMQEVPESTVLISRGSEGIMIAIPKRAQTAEEVMLTKQFAAEVIDLLKLSPDQTMLFNKFVPAYHLHFGRQCKVSDYGFNKLIELFEAIPDVVKIEELPHGERIVRLTLQKSLSILGTQVVQIAKSAKYLLFLKELPLIYFREFGYHLKPQLYECDNLEQVVSKLGDYVEVLNSDAGPLLVAKDVDRLPNILIRSWALLFVPPFCKDLDIFKSEYCAVYNSNITLEHLQKITKAVSITSKNGTKLISLTPLFVLAAELYHAIYSNGGSVMYCHIEKLYYDYHNKPLRLYSFNINSMAEFYDHFNMIFFIKYKKKKSVVVLNRNLADHHVPLKTPSSPVANRKSGALVPLEMPKIVAAKPDTPTTPGKLVWSPTMHDNLNLCIPMPLNSSLLNLIPSARSLWPADSTEQTVPPDPTELPMPDELIIKGTTHMNNSDSGVMINLDHSPSENDVSSSQRRFGGGANSSFANFMNFKN
nr:unnamed protein product [Callosobruchus chinensis]